MTKRFILGAALVSAGAFAANVDDDFREFVQDVMTQEKATNRVLRDDVEKKLKTYDKKVSVSDTRPLEKQIKKLGAEKIFLENVDAELPASIEPKIFEQFDAKFKGAAWTELDEPAGKETRAQLDARQAVIDGQINEATKIIEAYKKIEKPQAGDTAKYNAATEKLPKLNAEKTEITEVRKSKRAVEKEIPLGKNERILLVARVRKGADNKMVMTFTAKWNKAKLKDLPDPEVRGQYSDAELESLMSTLGDHFGDEFEIKEPIGASVADALKKARESSALASFTDDIDAKIKERRSKLGKSDESDTLIGDATKKLNDKKGIGNEEKKKDLKARIKIIDWLKTHSAAGKTVCEIYQAALGEWANFPKEAQEDADCQSLNPRKRVADKSALEGPQPGQSASDAAQREQMEQIYQQRYYEADAQCRGKGAVEAMQVLSRETEKAVTDLELFLKRDVVPKCDSLTEYFLKGGGIDRTNDPMAAQASVDVNPVTVRKVIENYGKSEASQKRLENEVEMLTICKDEFKKKIAQAEGIKGSTIRDLEAALASGKPLPVDPAILNSHNAGIRQMYEWLHQASALQIGITAELDARANFQNNRLGSSGGNSTGGFAPSGAQGVQVNGGGSGGGVRLPSSKKKKGKSNKPRMLQ